MGPISETHGYIVRSTALRSGHPGEIDLPGLDVTTRRPITNPALAASVILPRWSDRNPSVRIGWALDCAYRAAMREHAVCTRGFVYDRNRMLTHGGSQAHTRITA